jgi:hypothetical protein
VQVAQHDERGSAQGIKTAATPVEFAAQ